MTVKISRALHAELLALADAKPGEEVCGLLFGKEDRIEHFVETANISSVLNDSFAIDPAALIAAHKAERAGGPKVIGHFHSHPNSRFGPSACDEGNSAGDGALWLIIAGGQAGLWRASSPGKLQPVEYLLID
jgi:desampylase